MLGGPPRLDTRCRDNELFAAQTTDDRAVVAIVTQRTCHRDQRIVASAVSIVIVELFEAIQVDHGDDEITELVATLL